MKCHAEWDCMGGFRSDQLCVSDVVRMLRDAILTHHFHYSSAS